MLDDLDERINEEGIEALDATHLTWHRLLATSQALYEGATFEDVTLPSYGGSLFDPDRFSFLTARDSHGMLTITVSDRVMVEALRAVQVARLRGQPARRISFRDIDVEQIGYIYEGLLGYSCADVKEVTVGLIGKEGEEPEIPLSALEALRAGKSTDAAFADAILAWVKEHQAAATPPTKAALAKALKDQKEQIQIEDAERTLRSLTTDPVLRDRLRPFIGIIRRDLRNRPLVVVRGGCSWSRRPPARPRARTTPPSRSPRTSSDTPWSPWSTTRAPISASTAGYRSTPTASSTSRSPTSPAARARSWSLPPATSPTAWSRPGSGSGPSPASRRTS